MPDHDEVKIKIKTILDSLGADQAKQILKEIQKEAEGVGGKGRSAFGKFRESLSGTAAAAKYLRHVLNGLGVIAVIATLAKMVGKINEVINARKKMTAEIQSQNDAQAVAKITEAYDRLKERIAEANEELKHANGLENMRLENARKLEDARLRAEEEAEVDALGRADPDRAEKERAIRARYAQRRGEVSGARSEEDIEREALRKEQRIAQIKEQTGRMDEMDREDRQARSARQDLADRAFQGAKGWGFGDLFAGGSQKRAMMMEEGQRHAGMAGAHASAILARGKDREEAKEAEARYEQSRKIHAEQGRKADRASADADRSAAALSAFDSSRWARTTTNTAQRDAQRAPMAEAAKQTDATLQAALRALEMTAETMKRYEREFNQVKSRLKAAGVDSYSD